MSANTNPNSMLEVDGSNHRRSGCHNEKSHCLYTGIAVTSFRHSTRTQLDTGSVVIKTIESTHHMCESKWSNTCETRSRQRRDFQWWFSRTDLLCWQQNIQTPHSVYIATSRDSPFLRHRTESQKEQSGRAARHNGLVIMGQRCNYPRTIILAIYY